MVYIVVTSLLINIFLYFCFKIKFKKELDLKLAINQESQRENSKKEVAKALNSSRAVLKGQINEQLCPFLPGFEYKPSDFKFLGQPIDGIVFEGMTDGEVTNVILVDIKTGAANLTKVQRQVRDCLKEGKFEFKKLNV